MYRILRLPTNEHQRKEQKTVDKKYEECRLFLRLMKENYIVVLLGCCWDRMFGCKGGVDIGEDN